MALYCLDASVVLAWLLDEGLPLVDDFWESVTNDDEMICAELLRSECTSTIREAVYDGRIDLDRGTRLLQELAGMPIRVVTIAEQFPRAFELARRFQHRKAYDMHYLAVAEMEGAELLTVDRGLRHAANEVGVPARLLR